MKNNQFDFAAFLFCKAECLLVALNINLVITFYLGYHLYSYSFSNSWALSLKRPRGHFEHAIETLLKTIFIVYMKKIESYLSYQKLSF
jgi:hypothetical protein